MRTSTLVLLTLLFTGIATQTEAQRRGERGGNRPAPAARPQVNRPAPAARPQVNRPAPHVQQRPARDFKANQGIHGNEHIGGGNNAANAHRNFGNNKPADVNRNNNNNVNIHRNNNNVNVNRNNVHVNNNNVIVNRPVTVVARPAYRVYPGRIGYYYHPYVPYRGWGPAWHPLGFLVTTLAVTAIVVSVNEQKYHYDQGVYYSQQPSGSYSVVPAPLGAVVSSLPSGYSVANVDGVSYYYYNGAFYTRSGSSYTVVAPPQGAVIGKLPEGAKEVTIDGNKYVEYNGTYYQPVSQNGQNSYEVVAAE